MPPLPGLLSLLLSAEGSRSGRITSCVGWLPRPRLSLLVVPLVVLVVLAEFRGRRAWWFFGRLRPLITDLWLGCAVAGLIFACVCVRVGCLALDPQRARALPSRPAAITTRSQRLSTLIARSLDSAHTTRSTPHLTLIPTHLDPTV